METIAKVQLLNWGVIGMKWLGGFVVFLLFWALSLLARKIIRRIARRLPEGKREVVELLASLVQFLFLILGIVSALGTIGMDVSALVASLGLTGFALGFALKDALSNLLAGILILFYQPFQRQDHIKVGAFTGQVQEMNLRYTTLKNPDGEIYLIPNSTLLTNTIVLKEKDG